MRFLFKTRYDQDIALFKHAGQRFWYGLLLFALLLAPFAVSEYMLSQLVFICIYGIVGLAARARVRALARPRGFGGRTVASFWPTVGRARSPPRPSPLVPRGPLRRPRSTSPRRSSPRSSNPPCCF